jgi:Flp pilus assembly protein TadB
MSRWKLFAVRAGGTLLCLVATLVFFLLDRRFGQFNVFVLSILVFASALVLAICWERRRRRLRRQGKVARRVG